MQQQHSNLPILTDAYAFARSLARQIKQGVLLQYRTIKQETIQLQGVRVRIKNLSKPLCQALSHGYYEAEEMSLLKSYLSPNDIVMEIGAGIGFLSSYCAKSIGSDRVFAFEANPLMRSHIEDTYQLNAVLPSIDFCILAESEGTTTFYVEKDFWSSSTVSHTSEALAIQVPTKSLNQEIRRINPTFLILDIEGGEYDLLQFIEFHNIETVLIEIHDGILGTDKANEVRKTLDRFGFKQYDRFDNADVSLDVSLWKRHA